MTLFGREFHFSWGKAFVWLIVLLVLAFIGSFLWRMNGYYWAIKSGRSNPMMDEQLKMSVGKAIQAGPVDPEYAKHLIIADAPSLGPTTAALTIVEFLDFDCPYCQAAFPSVRELESRFGDRVRLVVRWFPLSDVHPTAEIAARAGYCAQLQGKFWAYHDKLFSNVDQRSEDQLVQMAVGTGMNEGGFKTCLESQAAKDAVQKGVNDGISAGVAGTPTFFFNGTRIPGWAENDAMAYLIQTWLDQLGQQATSTKARS